MLSKGILRKSKREFFAILNEKDLSDNKKFWGIVKSLLLNKVVFSEKITLVEDDNIVVNDTSEPVSHNIGGPLMKAIIKYRFHLGIIATKENRNSGLSFSFSQVVERDEIMKEINNLIRNKATQSTGILTKLIKKNSNIFGDFIFGNYNNCVSYSIFPNSLKNAIITPVHKKRAKTSKDNYRPASILSNIFKICKIKD